MTLAQRLRRFWKNTDAAVALEAVIITPFLAWTFVASFVFFDAYRVYTTSVKATYTIADVISREQQLFPRDMEGFASIFSHMVRHTGDIQMRVSQIRWEDDEYRVDWSEAVGGQARLFDVNMPALADQLPVMVTGERLVLVETFVPYEPFFDIGMELTSFNNFTFTRPRYFNRVTYVDENPPPSI